MLGHNHSQPARGQTQCSHHRQPGDRHTALATDRQPGDRHTVLWQHFGPSCSGKLVFLPCDVSDIEAEVTPRVQGLQELPLELRIFCHVFFHQVSFILEQQWGTHLGEGMMLKCCALPLSPMEPETESQTYPSHQCCLQERCDIFNTNMSNASVQQSTDLCLSDEHSQDLLQQWLQPEKPGKRWNQG